MNEKNKIYDCGVIQDLLPLYQDDVCSDRSRIIVEEHLKECEQCSDFAEKLKKNEYDEKLHAERNSVLDSFARKEKRRSATIGMATAGILMVPLIVCLICNLAIGHGLDWFFVVFTSLLVAASVTVVPLMVQKNRVMWTMAAFLISLTLLLADVCIFTGGDWFTIAVVPSVAGLSMFFMPYIIRHITLPEALKNQKALLTMIWETICVYAIIITCGISLDIAGYWKIALPITAFSLLLPWVIFLCVRYIRCSAYTKTGIILLICGIFSTFVNDVVDAALGQFTTLNILKADFTHWNGTTNNGNVSWIMLTTCVVLGIAFLIAGVVKRNEK